MNFNIQNLIDAIEEARKGFIDAIKTLSDEQVRFKPSQHEWSILEIAEHMVWAEQIGVCGMFNAIEGLKKNQPIWSGDSPNEGLSVEQIVNNTWQAKETVPEVAKPKWGGSIMFWISSLKGCRHLLIDLVKESESVNLHDAIYPHPISGPMDVVQRLAFLRFHLERHTAQINRVKAHDQYPT